MIVQGCGFQLRGSLDISPDVSPLYLQQNSVIELGREIKSLLATNKVALSDDLTQANSQLVLLNETKQSRVLSVDSSGRAREYSLTYTANFIISAQKTDLDDVQLKQQQDSITLSRTLLFDSDAVLAVTNESELLYKEMRRNAARLILLKLQARLRDQPASNGNSLESDKVK